MQNKDTALKVSGFIFLLVGLMHLARFFNKTQVVLGTFEIPVKVSLVGFLVGLFLAIWMFKASTKAAK